MIPRSFECIRCESTVDAVEVMSGACAWWTSQSVTGYPLDYPTVIAHCCGALLFSRGVSIEFVGSLMRDWFMKTKSVAS